MPVWRHFTNVPDESRVWEIQRVKAASPLSVPCHLQVSDSAYKIHHLSRITTTNWSLLLYHFILSCHHSFFKKFLSLLNIELSVAQSCSHIYYNHIFDIHYALTNAIPQVVTFRILLLPPHSVSSKCFGAWTKSSHRENISLPSTGLSLIRSTWELWKNTTTSTFPTSFHWGQYIDTIINSNWP